MRILAVAWSLFLMVYVPVYLYFLTISLAVDGFSDKRLPAFAIDTLWFMTMSINFMRF